MLFGEGTWERNFWLYFTEQELAPGAIRLNEWKAAFNTRGDNGAIAGPDVPAPQLGWRGANQYVATAPQIFNLWKAPQERYDIFMTIGRENTWAVAFFMGKLSEVIDSYHKFPPRKMQSETYTGTLTIDRFRVIEKLKPMLEKHGIQVNQ